MSKISKKFKEFAHDNWSPPCIGDYVEFCVSSADKLYDEHSIWKPRFLNGVLWSHGVVTDLCRETMYSGVEHLSWEILCDNGELYEVTSNEFIGKAINFHPIRTLSKAKM